VMERVRTVQHERLTIQEAAHRLGVSESAIRKRIKRGTLKREKTEDGRVLVYMETPAPTSAPGAEEVRTPERDVLISQMQERLAFLEHELEVRSEEMRRDSDALISQMQERIASLERRLDQEREANSEHRRLLLRALERIPPQLEAPQEPPGSPQKVEEDSERAAPRPATSGPQESTWRRWRRRWFGQ
jgi:excisionase family DNA binding protein